MNIIVFGASGGTGREVVAQGIAANHQVTAFVRTPGKLTMTHDRLRVIQGDVTDARAVERAITGQQAVLCCVGAANPVAPYPAFVEGVKNILHGMGLAAVRRLIYLSFLGVPASRDQGGFLVRHVVRRILKGAIADHATNEQAIMQSGVDWTIVRAPKLTGGPRTGRVRAGEGERATMPMHFLSQADVADFMLRQLMDTTFVHKAPLIFPA